MESGSNNSNNTEGGVVDTLARSFAVRAVITFQEEDEEEEEENGTTALQQRHQPPPPPPTNTSSSFVTFHEEEDNNNNSNNNVVSSTITLNCGALLHAAAIIATTTTTTTATATASSSTAGLLFVYDYMNRSCGVYEHNNNNSSSSSSSSSDDEASSSYGRLVNMIIRDINNNGAQLFSIYFQRLLPMVIKEYMKQMKTLRQNEVFFDNMGEAFDSMIGSMEHILTDLRQHGTTSRFELERERETIRSRLTLAVKSNLDEQKDMVSINNRIVELQRSNWDGLLSSAASSALVQRTIQDAMIQTERKTRELRAKLDENGQKADDLSDLHRQIEDCLLLHAPPARSLPTPLPQLRRSGRSRELQDDGQELSSSSSSSSRTATSASTVKTTTTTTTTALRSPPPRRSERLREKQQHEQEEEQQQQN